LFNQITPEVNDFIDVFYPDRTGGITGAASGTGPDFIFQNHFTGECNVDVFAEPVHFSLCFDKFRPALSNCCFRS